MVIAMVLTNGYDPDPRVRKEAEFLADRGFRVVLLCWDRQNACRGRAVETCGGITAVRFSPRSEYGTGLRKQWRAYLSFVVQCRSYLRTLPYDVLHCHDLDGAVAGLFSNVRRAPLVFDMHEYYAVSRHRAVQALQKRAVRFVQNRSAEIIFLNGLQKSEVSKRNRKKLVFLPNYPEGFSRTDKVPGPKLRVSYIGTVRHYGPLKNLILAAEGEPSVSLCIHGRGPCLQKLRNEFEGKSRCRFTGGYSTGQLEDLYRTCDLLFCVYSPENPNDRAAFPNKFYEAVASGTPLLVSRGTELSRFVEQNRIGFSVDGGDPGSIRAALRKAEGEPGLLEEFRRNLLRLNGAGRYLWKNVSGNLDRIYGPEGLAAGARKGTEKDAPR